MERLHPPVLELARETLQHPHWALVERVAGSQCFQSSARLKEFLFYVADCALKGAPEDVTEQLIGIHVFQRPPGYNSSEDSIVRTHARYLRQRLSEYFSDEGAEEEIIISIPKGHYVPLFEPRVTKRAPTAIADSVTAPGMSPSVVVINSPAPISAAAKAKRLPVGRWFRPEFRLRWLGIAAAVILLAAGIGAVVHFLTKPDLVTKFWAPFLAHNSTLVIYSNEPFVGDSKTGLRYVTPSGSQQQPLPANYVDTYTGIGELTAVYDLTRLFDRHHASFMLKRSMLATWDEARQSNLIFLGSTAENPSLRALPATQDFRIMAGDGFAGIVNQHPLAGEPALWERPEHPLTMDYAILALLPGLQPGKKMLVCSGLTTMGTQATVEFVLHQETLALLLNRITDRNGNVHAFEAVLGTTIVGGVPVEPRLVTVHVHQ